MDFDNSIIDYHTMSQIVYIINIVLNSITIFLNLLLFIIYRFLVKYQWSKVRRISFKLACNLSIFYIGRSIGILIYTIQPKLIAGWCGFVMWLILFNSVVIYTVFILISLNLILSFLNLLQYQTRWIRAYYLLGFLIPFAFTIVPFIMGFYNYNEAIGKCTLFNSYEVVNLINWVCYNIWIILCFVFCTLTAIFCVIYLKPKVIQLKDRITRDDPTRQTENLLIQLKKLINRINLYSWIPFICLLFPVIELIYNQTTYKSNSIITLLSILTINSIGIVHFIIFLLDPALQNAYYSLQTEMLTYYDVLEENKKELNLKQRIQYYLVYLFFVPKSYLIARDYASANLDSDELTSHNEIGIILDNHTGIDLYNDDDDDECDNETDNNGQIIPYNNSYPPQSINENQDAGNQARIQSFYNGSFYLTDYDQHLNIL